MPRLFASRLLGNTAGGGGGGGSAPASPTLAVADNGDGTGGVATISGSDPGTTNELFYYPVDGSLGNVWTSYGSRVSDGTIDVGLPAGEYLFYVISTDVGSATSNVALCRFSDPAVLGLLTGPALRLRELLAEVPSCRAFLGATSQAEAKARIHTSYLEGKDLRPLRPYIVVLWQNFQMETIAGGDRNYLWPRSPRLRVLVCDNDKNPKDPTESDRVFHQAVEQILEEITDRAGLDDRLAISAVELEQTPARNPREEWNTEQGAYLWCSFIVSYD